MIISDDSLMSAGTSYRLKLKCSPNLKDIPKRHAGNKTTRINLCQIVGFNTKQISTTNGILMKYSIHTSLMPYSLHLCCLNGECMTTPYRGYTCSANIDQNPLTCGSGIFVMLCKRSKIGKFIQISIALFLLYWQSSHTLLMSRDLMLFAIIISGFGYSSLTICLL